MLKRRKIKKKGLLLLVGLFLLLVGIIIILYIPINTIKNKVFSEMKLAIYQDEINEDNETINDIGTNTISKSNNNQTENTTTNTNTETPKKYISYTYIGQLSIPKIRFKRGFVKKESKYNNIEYNITIAKEADYPDVKNGNFILMAHSGDAPISFFEPLYKLELGDTATVSYNAKAYYYKLVKTYQVEKTGKIAIYRDYDKKTLTLITCTHDDLTKQSVYIFEQTKE